MLNEAGVAFEYRDYRQNPLSQGELRELIRELGTSPAALLRRRDPAFAKLNLSGEEAPDELIAHMSRNPTLLARPIGRRDGRAVVGRPPSLLLEF